MSAVTEQLVQLNLWLSSVAIAWFTMHSIFHHFTGKK